MLEMLAVTGLRGVDCSCPQSCLQSPHRAPTEPRVRYNARRCDHKLIRYAVKGLPEDTELVFQPGSGRQLRKVTAAEFLAEYETK